MVHAFVLTITSQLGFGFEWRNRTNAANVFLSLEIGEPSYLILTVRYSSPQPCRHELHTMTLKRGCTGLFIVLQIGK